MKLGNIATGDDFFDRIRIREEIWHSLEKNHLILRGVRRLGKSSILKKIEEEAEQKGFLVLNEDVGGAVNAEQFIQLLTNALPEKKIQTFLNSLTNGLKKISQVKLTMEDISIEISLHDIGGYHWYSAAKKLQKRLTEYPIIIQIDEFSVFLEKLIEQDKAEADALLSWLRSWRQTDTACRFIFTGSIGVTYLLAKHQLDTRLNDCHEIVVKDFSHKEACKMIKIQTQRLEWEISTVSIEYLCKKVGWLSPYYLNLLLKESHSAAIDREDELELTEQQIKNNDIDAGYESLLILQSRFIHWINRLSKSLEGGDFDFCKDILSAIANTSEGLTLLQLSNRLAKRQPDPDKRQEKIRELLNKLEDEGYLTPANSKGRFNFLSFLLRDYWKRHYV